MLENLTFLDFQPFLNQTFSIRFTPEVIMPAELIAGQNWGEVPDNQRQPFNLIFRTAQKNEYYPQAIYTLLHPTLGELPIFFVPLGPDKLGMRYESVFN